MSRVTAKLPRVSVVVVIGALLFLAIWAITRVNAMSEFRLTSGKTVEVSVVSHGGEEYLLVTPKPHPPWARLHLIEVRAAAEDSRLEIRDYYQILSPLSGRQVYARDLILRPTAAYREDCEVVQVTSKGVVPLGRLGQLEN